MLLVIAAAFLLGVWSAHRPPAARGQGTPPLAAAFRGSGAARSHPGRTAASLVAVQPSRHSGFDRLELTFDRALPGWQVAYVPSVRDGAGRRLPLQGGAFLALTLHPAQAHAPGGAPSFQPPSITPAYHALRQVRLAGDFEGRVRLGLGVRARTGFRVLESSRPPRIIVDVRA